MTHIEDWAKDEDQETEQEDLEDHEVEDAEDRECEPPQVWGGETASGQRGVDEDVGREEP